MRPRVSLAIPLHITGIGKALPAVTPHTIDDEENELSTRCVGASVYDYRDTPIGIGGIGVSSMALELDERRVRALGHR